MKCNVHRGEKGGKLKWGPFCHLLGPIGWRTADANRWKAFARFCFSTQVGTGDQIRRGEDTLLRREMTQRRRWFASWCDTGGLSSPSCTSQVPSKQAVAHRKPPFVGETAQSGRKGGSQPGPSQFWQEGGRLRQIGRFAIRSLTSTCEWDLVS